MKANDSLIENKTFFSIIRNQEPYLIGLVGQSCTGKNKAAEILMEKGFSIIDADEITRNILHTYRDSIAAYFQAKPECRGRSLKTAKDTLNTKRLGLLLFSYPALLAEHEAFMFPKIEQDMQKAIASAFEKNADAPIVLNAPTLHKTSFIKKCKFILYLEAPYFLRMMRCRKRDGISYRSIFFRFLRQKNFLPQYLSQNADIVRVKNAGTAQKLKQTLERILMQKGM